MLGLSVQDATAGFRAYHRDNLSRIDLDHVRADGYGFQVEMTYLTERNGGRIVEVPITFRDRSLGRSKMSGRIVVEAFMLVTWWAVRDRLFQQGARRCSARDTETWPRPSSPSRVRSWSRPKVCCSCATCAATVAPTGARPAA